MLWYMMLQNEKNETFYELIIPENDPQGILLREQCKVQDRSYSTPPFV